MAEILLDEQGTPATPAAGTMLLYPDSSASTFVQKNDAGSVQGDSMRAASASQLLAASDTYLTNSGMILPAFSMQAGMVIEWVIYVSKTAAGTATPIYQIRIGANQTTADTSRLSMTGLAQTAVVDAGEIRIVMSVRVVSASGIIQGAVNLQHNLAATGLATLAVNVVNGTSAAFDNTALQGQFVGLSINAGASSAWTVQQCIGRIWYG